MLRAGLTSRVVSRCVTSRSRVSPLSLPCSVCFGLHRAILAEGTIIARWRRFSQFQGGADHQRSLAWSGPLHPENYLRSADSRNVRSQDDSIEGNGERKRGDTIMHEYTFAQTRSDDPVALWRTKETLCFFAAIGPDCRRSHQSSMPLTCAFIYPSNHRTSFCLCYVFISRRSTWQCRL